MIYLPPSQLKTTYLDSSDNALDIYCNYEKVALVGNFNAKIEVVLTTSYFHMNCKVQIMSLFTLKMLIIKIV